MYLDFFLDTVRQSECSEKSIALWLDREVWGEDEVGVEELVRKSNARKGETYGR